METELFKHLHSLEAPHHTTLFAVIKNCGPMGNIHNWTLSPIPGIELLKPLESPERQDCFGHNEMTLG